MFYFNFKFEGWGRYCFHRYLSVHRWVPHLHPVILSLFPCPFWGGGPQPGQDLGGTLWYPNPGQVTGQDEEEGG